MRNNFDVRIQREDVIEVKILDSSRAINDVAYIVIRTPMYNEVSFYFPYDQAYDGDRMTLGEFMDKMTAAMEEAFELREGAHQRREDAEEERHSKEVEND